MTKNLQRAFLSGFLIVLLFSAVLLIRSLGSKQVLGVQTGIPINHVNTNKQAVALTFDDGPSLATMDILVQLELHKTNATFFLVGQNIEKFPEVMQQLKKSGSEIGNHTDTHPWFWYLATQEKIGKEIIIGEEKINDSIGIRPTLFRAPYGWYPANLLKVLNTLQVTTIGWDVDPEDWRKPEAEVIAQRVLDNVQPGSIILLHDGPYTADRRNTVKAVPLIIEGLWEKGYDIVTVSELLKLQQNP